MHKNGIFFDLVFLVTPLDPPPKFTPSPIPPLLEVGPLAIPGYRQNPVFLDLSVALVPKINIMLHQIVFILFVNLLNPLKIRELRICSSVSSSFSLSSVRPECPFASDKVRDMRTDCQIFKNELKLDVSTPQIIFYKILILNRTIYECEKVILMKVAMNNKHVGYLRNQPLNI